MDKGLFITFEGIDGCGKSSMLSFTADWLKQAGFSCLTTREPGGSDLGCTFRAMLLDSCYGSVDCRTETLLYIVDRSRHVENVIKPALADGRIVLCDRYIDSTIAYQGGGRGLDAAALAAFNDFAIRDVYPDLTLLFRLPVEQAMSRLHGDRDRLEQESVSFFQRVADAYDELAAKNSQRFAVVDASRRIEEVFIQVKEYITVVMREKGLLND